MDDPVVLTAIGLAVLLAIVLAVRLAGRRRRALQERFGTEYDRVAAQHDSRKEAHDELETRIERRDGYELRPVDDSAAVEYVERWRELQRRFVDDPASGLLAADALVTEVATRRGYPGGDGWDRQAADLSVDHSDLMDDLRTAREVAAQASRSGPRTEEMRDALMRYRAVFERLVGRPVVERNP